MINQEIVKTREGEKVRLQDAESSEPGWCIVLERRNSREKNLTKSPSRGGAEMK